MQASETAQSTTSKKGSMTMLWEYAVKSAVSHQELTEHEGHQVIQCWNDTDQLQDNNEKNAKFKKLLSMKFGPSKGNTVHDLMVKRRDQTIQMVQQKQMQKRQQQQSMTNNTVDLTGGTSASQVSSQPQFPQQQGPGQGILHPPQNLVSGQQQQQQQQQNFNYNQQLAQPGNAPQHQQSQIQQQFVPQGGSSFPPMNNSNTMNNSMGINLTSVSQPGTFNTFNTLPPGATGVTGFPGQAMGTGPLLAPNNLGGSNLNGNMMSLPGGGYTGGGANLNQQAPMSNSMGLASGSSNLLNKPSNVIFNNPSHLQNLSAGSGSMANPNMNNMNMAPNAMNNSMSNMNSMNNTMPMNISNNLNNPLNHAANLAAAQANANNAKKPAAPKRTAGKAGLDDAGGDKKPAKKRNPPAKPSVPGQGQGQMMGAGMGQMQMQGHMQGGMQGQMQGQLQGQLQGQMQGGANGVGGFAGMQQPGQQGLGQIGLPAGLNTNPNRPLNTPGGAGYYTGYNGAAGGAGGASNNNLSGMQQASAQPPTVAQEIEGMTERMNSAQEGIEPAGDNALSAPLSLPQDFLRNETDLAREKLRLGLSAAVGLNLPGPTGGQGANRFQPGGGYGVGAGTHAAGGPSMAQHEAMQPWQYHNIVDKGIMARAAVHVLEGRDLKIGVPSLNALSTGIQQHLKNVLEAAFKTSKSRINRTALNSYEGISRMIVEHGKGHALPENQQNIAIRWSEDVRSILQSEELTARKSLKQYDTALEESLQEKMKAFDEERGKTGNKRKLGDADIPWWTKEDGAEKAGLLGWSDLAMVSFKNSVARKHELGAHAHSSKKGRSSLPGRTHVAPAKPNEDASLPSGVPGAAGTQGGVSSAGAGSAGQNGNSAESGAAVATVDWSHQPCPLSLPRSSQVTLLEEDLAGTLARSSGSRALPNTGVLSSTRTTGTCLYKWKMGVYTGAAAANP